MKKTAILGLVGLLVVGILAVGAFAMPFARGNVAVKTALDNNDFASWKEAMTSELTEERFQEMRQGRGQLFEHHEERDQAIQQGYDAWLEAMGDRPVTNVITAENFDRFVEMHNAKVSGDYETAGAIAEELGLPEMQGKDGLHKGFGKGQGIGGCQH